MASVGKTGKRRKFESDEERKAAEASRKKHYDKQRVHLGKAWVEWERQREMEGIESQVEWAEHLLSLHEEQCMKMPAVQAMAGSQAKDREDSPKMFDSGPGSDTDDEAVDILYVQPKNPGIYPGQPVIAETPQKSRKPDVIDLPVTGSFTPSQLDSPVLYAQAATSTPRYRRTAPIRLQFESEGDKLSDIEWESEEDTEDYMSSSDDDINDPDWEIPFNHEKIELDFGPKTMSPDEAIASQKCIAFAPCLQTLLESAVGMKCKVCKATLHYERKMVGTCFKISWKCPKKEGHHEGVWSSQPQIGDMWAGNILVPSCLVTSGNNFAKVALMAKFLNLGFVSKSSHYRVQRLYIYPAVERYWLDMQESLLEQVSGKPLVLAGDGRNDSPGYSAQYLTYSLMDVETGYILSIKVVDVREADGKSPNMEKIGFMRALAEVREKAEVVEIVSDAHPQIKALIKKNYPEIEHQFDVWHMSKNLSKRISKIGKKSGFELLMQWVPAIRNHLWYCSQNCKGNEKHLKENWVTVLHHVCNVHEWTATQYCETEGHCNHPIPLPASESDKPWLTRESPPHKALVQEVFSHSLMSNLKYIRNFRHTSLLEHFHSTLLMYCPKRNAYRYRGFTLRNLLGAIDHNEHQHREVVKDKDGKIKLRSKYSKAAKTWTGVPTREPKMYTYMPGLLADIIEEKMYSGSKMKDKAVPLKDDPTTIKKNIAAKPKPPPEVLRQQYEERRSMSQQQEAVNQQLQED